MAKYFFFYNAIFLQNPITAYYAETTISKLYL